MSDNVFGPGTIIQHGVMDEEAKVTMKKKQKKKIYPILRSCASTDQGCLVLNYTVGTKVVVCTVISTVELDLK